MEGRLNKYAELLAALATTGRGTMRCAGSSMLPLLTNPSICDYERADSYEVGDVVFSKVGGRYIDAHKVTRVGADGRFLIANNHGHENGWTRKVYGRVVEARDKTGRTHYRAKPRTVTAHPKDPGAATPEGPGTPSP